MTIERPEVAAARIRADRARARLVESVRAFETPLLELRSQLTPSHLIGDAWDAAKSKGADLAEDAVDAARARPLVATGVVAAITMFLAREPLKDLAGQLINEASAKRKARKQRKAKSTPNPTEALHDRPRRTRRASPVRAAAGD